MNNMNSPVLRSDLRADVVIVGGGLAGLACALGLRTSALKVVVLEQTGSLGGRARSWIDPKSGDAIDIGPHVLLSEYSNLLSMLEQLGTHDRIMWQPDKLIRLIGGGRSAEMHARRLTPPLHLRPSLAKLRELSLRDKLANGALSWLATQIREEDVLKLDDVSAAQLLQTYGVAPRFVEWFWASACMALMNVPLERCSAGALMRAYAQLIGHRSCRFGFADCSLSELFVPAAVRAIMASGGRVHLRARAVALIYRDGRAAGVILEDGTQVFAPHCVMALPPQALAQLLPARCGAQRPFRDMSVFEPSPYISTYLWLDRKISQEKFWARVWSPEMLNCDFYDLSNIRAQWHERASVIASNIIYSHRAANLSDEEVVTATLRELTDAAPAAARAKVLHSVVNRIPMAIPCPAPGTEQKRPEAKTPIPGLLLAGDWTRTQLPACMESAVRSGSLAAEQVWHAIGRPCQLALETRPPEGLAGLVHRLSGSARRGNARELPAREITV